MPSIPVPRVYDWDDGVSGTGPPFTAEEFIDGERLSVVWPQLTGAQRSHICGQIANVVADLGETRFNSIGSLTSGETSDPTVGPTVEAAKVFNGRVRGVSFVMLLDISNECLQLTSCDCQTKFHSPDCYDIGPYANSRDYVLACYDREIYHYAHADAEDIEDFLEDTTASDFIDQLKRRRHELLDSKYDDVFRRIDSEPHVLVHEDFHAGNMLVRDGVLVAVLDWEFSGVYPLSQLLGRAQVLQISMPLDDRTEVTEREEDGWHEHYRHKVRDVVEQRSWAKEDVETLFGDGHEVLNVARMIMFPSPE